jgi:hypothetical protein
MGVSLRQHECRGVGTVNAAGSVPAMRGRRRTRDEKDTYSCVGSTLRCRDRSGTGRDGAEEPVVAWEESAGHPGRQWRRHLRRDGSADGNWLSQLAGSKEWQELGSRRRHRKHGNPSSGRHRLRGSIGAAVRPARRIRRRSARSEEFPESGRSSGLTTTDVGVQGSGSSGPLAHMRQISSAGPGLSRDTRGRVSWITSLQIPVAVSSLKNGLPVAATCRTIPSENGSVMTSRQLPFDSGSVCLGKRSLDPYYQGDRPYDGVR